ncbi:MAG: FAD-binding protein, partial [Myxococcota bacterium]|nr:FAD-binding protein [Myxococcota bacterium]
GSVYHGSTVIGNEEVILMLALWSLLFTGCLTGGSSGGLWPGTGTGGSEDTGDTGAAPPLESVDVLVVGSGPAGLAAALQARDQGAEVLVLEMDEQAGGSGLYAQNFFAVATPWQQDRGISDSTDLALDEWSEFTRGGNAEDPAVISLVERSGETLEWLVERGCFVTDLAQDPGAGSIPRVHQVTYSQAPPVSLFVDELVDDTWLNTRVDALRIEDGVVVGVEVTRLGEGSSGWISAGVTVVASGGFARNLDMIYEDRPELEDMDLVIEASHMSMGSGHALLEGVGADFQNPGTLGVYVHAMSDQREGMGGEAVVLKGLSDSIVIDVTGERVMNENESLAFGAYDFLLGAEDETLWALVPEVVFHGQSFGSLGFMWESSKKPDSISAFELIALGMVKEESSVEQLVEEIGVDRDGLVETLSQYEEYVSIGIDSGFGKDGANLVSFAGGPYYAAKLAPGSAKSFGGVATDGEGRVLDSSGTQIPGLYAAGEVAGMLGTEAVGYGFSGSVTACYLGGRIAGQAAAEQLGFDLQ